MVCLHVCSLSHRRCDSAASRGHSTPVSRRHERRLTLFPGRGLSASLFTTLVGGLHFAICRSVTGMGAQPSRFSHTKSNFAAGEWQSRQGFFDDVLSTLSPRSRIVVPSAETFKAKNSQPLKGCLFMLYHCLGRDQLQNCTCGIFLIGPLSLKIWMASLRPFREVY